ncbi:TetR/AcrR family transcriptional regulator [Microbulbifer magnicolonia]|uniref:TetR/AcrR family transcriptional regulator n=1 Tax=Microbulbifer magnicolonia TaxID=3109744 RepID=UPI002B403071|nr:TetR/AcrR family transcriptional regulator [Microbulbifer sp. GG15]
MSKPDFTLVELPVPNQVRSQQALERLLAAGEQLLAENRFEEASVAEIARLADSSVGSFYRLLGDKDTLSLLLLQRFMRQVATTAESLGEAGGECTDLAQCVQLLVDSYVGIYAGHRGVLRALILRASRSADFRDKVHQLNNHVSTTALECLRPFVDQINHAKPELAIPAGVHMMLGVMNQYIVTGSLGGLPQAELRRELGRLLLCYLQAPADCY